MRRNKKFVVIALLLIVVLGMGVGYSILSKQLKIEGNATIDSDFNVEIIDMHVADLYKTTANAMYCESHFCSGGVSNGVVTQNIEPSFTATTATFDVTLGVNAEVAYQINLKNQGDISAVIDDIVINQTGATAIKIETPIDIKGFTLAPGQILSYFVVLSYDGLGEVNENELTSNISITFDVKQKTDLEPAINKPYIYFGAGLGSPDGTGVYGTEIFGLNLNSVTINSPTDLYVSINGSQYELVLRRETLDGPGGSCFPFIYRKVYEEETGYILDHSILQEGNNIIKLKLLNDGVYSNEITLNYYYEK